MSGSAMPVIKNREALEDWSNLAKWLEDRLDERAFSGELYLQMSHLYSVAVREINRLEAKADLEADEQYQPRTAIDGLKTAGKDLEALEDWLENVGAAADTVKLAVSVAVMIAKLVAV